MLANELKVGDIFICASPHHIYEPKSVYEVVKEGKFITIGHRDKYPHEKSVHEQSISSIKDWRVELLNDQFNLLEALIRLQKGKRVRRVEWGQNKYIVKKGNHIVWDNLITKIDLSNDLTDGGWEEHSLREIEVKLNNEYIAVVSKDGVKVGCQTFGLEKIEELAKALKEINLCV
jgi:hypothetical protein